MKSLSHKLTLALFSFLSLAAFAGLITLAGTFSLAMAALSAAVWLIILLLPWGPWLHRYVLNALPDDQGEDLSEITAVIPARNEAAILPSTLEGLAQQGSGMGVILVDDNSTDGTAETAHRVEGIDLHTITGQPLPEGWAGKLWALHQGIRQVETPLVLLLDADIRLAPGMAAALLKKMRVEGCQLVSIMASLHMGSFWEKLLMPAFIYFFKFIYPFRLANSRLRWFYSAAGGCMLIEKAALEAVGGLEAIRDALIDDCTLASRLKMAGFRTWTGQSRAVSCIRPYKNLGEIWNMVARSAYTQLLYSPFILILCLFFLFAMFAMPVAGVLGATGAARWLSLAAWLLMMITYLPTLLFYDIHPAWALLMPLSGLFYGVMTYGSAWRYYRGERSRWKGRVYR